MVQLTDGQTYASGSYLAALSPWGRGSYVQNVNYTESIQVNPSTFPNGVTIVSDWPSVAAPSGVYNFLAIDYGDYDNTQERAPITPAQIKNIGALSETHNLTLGGAKNNFDVIDDMFLTANPGSNSTHLDEVEVFLHTPSYSASYVLGSRQLGTFVASGKTWTVSSATGAAGVRDILVMPTDQSDILSGTVDLKSIFNNLISKNILTGNEYFNGFAMGSETHSGNGSTHISSFSVNYQPSSVGSITACFASGTRILTSIGLVEVERLSVGASVLTVNGQARTIRWIGHRTIDCGSIGRQSTDQRSGRNAGDVLPVVIAAHAFGKDKPLRDLTVSPGHAICVDVAGEVLIPAGALVNGATIRQVEVEEVTYWHVELDSHDIVLAENLPTESYLDMGNRCFFYESGVVGLNAAPDPAPSLRTHSDFCRPFHDGGVVVAAVKAQLAKRALGVGWSLTQRLDIHLDVDGQILRPVFRGLTVCFEVAAGAKAVWLVSPAARPCETMDTGDRRHLGLYLRGLEVDDGSEAPRRIAIDDPLLCIGFHEMEEGGRRWTAGRAWLPEQLWEACSDRFSLKVELAALPVPRWERPRTAECIQLSAVA